MTKKTSLKDIAGALGVSTALVSYVLNGKEKEARVNPNTARKIRQMAVKMKYQPNQVAKSLRSGKSLVIALIVADISNPFFAHLARTIEDESLKEGYSVFFVSSDENLKNSQKLIKTLTNRQIEGFIIAPTEGTDPQLEYLRELDVPFVLIDRYFKNVPASYVIIDNFKATYQATIQLLKQGHENIAFVRYSDKLQHTEDRFQGYLQALKEFKRPFSDNLICEAEFHNLTHFNRNFKSLLTTNDKIDAVLFSTNTLSTMGLKALKKMNIKIPDELAVFCFDESESYDLFYCPISYIRQPLDVIGKKAVQILMEQLTGKHKICQRVVLDAELVIKKSSERSVNSWGYDLNS